MIILFSDLNYSTKEAKQRTGQSVSHNGSYVYLDDLEGLRVRGRGDLRQWK